MELRAFQPADVERLRDIDGTIESSHYLHLDRAGDALNITWTLEERPLRQKLVEPNPLDADRLFLLKQIVAGTDEGLALKAEHDDALVAMLIAIPDFTAGTLRLVDLRVDYDYRRQGLGMGLVYQIIQHARERQLRAVMAETTTSNFPANQFLAKCGFDLAGIDSQRRSNHDLVKEQVTLVWYAALD